MNVKLLQEDESGKQSERVKESARETATGAVLELPTTNDGKY